MMNTQSIGGGWKADTLTTAAPSVVVKLAGAPLPCTLTLVSANSNRSIQLSPYGNASINFFQPGYDQSNANQVVVVLTASMDYVKFIGQSGDTWRIA